MPVDPVFAIETQALAQIIDELDYYAILKVEPAATPDELKAAYYRESRLYHPDRYFNLEDLELKKQIGTIYKRINEAWVVLRDDRKREKYTADVSGPDRAKKLRYTEASEEELKKAKEAELGTTPQGRKIFAAALLDLESRRYAQAVQNLKIAMMYEPQNAFFKQKLDEATRLASGK